MHLKITLIFALALTSVACTRSGGGEEAASDPVKAQATKDLSCDDVTVKKMAQDGSSYEYLATGCDDIYTYAVDCSARCDITAGVRGRGLGGLWNAADSLISGIAKDIDESDKRMKETRARHDKMREEIEARDALIQEKINQMRR